MKGLRQAQTDIAVFIAIKSIYSEIKSCHTEPVGVLRWKGLRQAQTDIAVSIVIKSIYSETKSCHTEPVEVVRDN